MQERGQLKLQKYTVLNRKIRSPRLRRAIQKAQRISEERERTARKSTMQYGESIRLQRERVYEERRHIQNISSFNQNYFLNVGHEIIQGFLSGQTEKTSDSDLMRFALDNISYNPEIHLDDMDEKSKENMEDYLLNIARRQLMGKLEILDSEEQEKQYFRMMVLKAIDESWIEEVDYLQQLKSLMEGRQYTQRNMMFEYHMEAYRSYGIMRKRIKKQMMRNILLGEIRLKENGDFQVVLP